MEKELAIFLRGQLDPAAFRRKCASKCSPSTRNSPSSERRRSMRLLSASLSERRFSMEMLRCSPLPLVARRAWNLWNDFVPGQRTYPRDWHSPRAGAQRGKILRMVLRQGLGLAIGGRRRGTGRRADRLAPDGRAALRRAADRSSHVCWGHAGAHSCSACCLLYPCKAGDAGRSAGRAALRIERRSQRVVVSVIGLTAKDQPT